MAKTYTAVPSVNTGDVYTAANYNTYTATNISNLIVPPACRLVRTTNQTITTGTDTIVSMGSAEYDTDGMGTTGASSRITINTAGLYLITMEAKFASVAASFTRLIAVAKNAGLTTRLVDVRFVQTTGWAHISGVTVAALTVGDYLTPYVYHDRGSSVDITVDSGYAASLTATWIGRTS